MKTIGRKFADRYKVFRDQILNAKFLNSLTKDLEIERMKYYENIEKCFKLVSESS